MRLLFTVILGIALQFNLFSQHNITVDVANVLSSPKSKSVGINVNHLMDGTYLVPSPAKSTTQALKDMNVKFLRYPGGEKADNYLWSVPPYDKPRPEVARTGNCEWPSNDNRFVNSDNKTFKSLILDFDEFITMCHAVGAEPLIVVGYDGMYKSGTCGTIPTKAQLIETAKQWVKYANITKGYNVKYWMVGNESYMSCSYNGCATATQYKNDVIDFSVAMKAIDPTIKIIANGDKSSWWQTVLPTASAHIDFLGLSNYPVWQYSGGYGYYRTKTPDFTQIVNTAVSSINQYAPSSERNRLKIIITEFGAMDWQGSWADLNDLGHSLVSFEIMGEQLKHPKIESSFLWNTRWVNNATQNNDIYDALNKNGGYNANGLAHSIWGRFFMEGNMVQATSNTQIRTFANHNPSTQKINLFFINKEITNQTVNVNLSGFPAGASGKKWEYKGNGIADVNPTLVQGPNITFTGNNISLSLPSTSITVLELAAPSGNTIVNQPTSNDQSRCGSGTLTLTATDGLIYRWFKNSTGGTILHTGPNFTTPNLSQTDSFYVANFDGYAESSRTKVKAIINALPPSPIANDASRCGSGTLTLTASGGSIYNWYSSPTGSQIIKTGSSFTTPILNSSTSYYVENVSSGCVSPRTSVYAEIKSEPIKPMVLRNSTAKLSCSEIGTTYIWTLNNQTTSANTREIDIISDGDYKVSYVGFNGCSSLFSDGLSVLVSSPVIPLNPETVKVYPNPNTGKFKIEVPDTGVPFEVKITDPSDNVIYFETFNGDYNKVNIDLNKKVKGLLLLIVTQGSKIYTNKVMVR